jgi:hypothetical protein
MLSAASADEALAKQRMKPAHIDFLALCLTNLLKGSGQHSYKTGCPARFARSTYSSAKRTGFRV